MSNKIDFRKRNIIRDKETSHNDKGINFQEDITILNMYNHDIRAFKYMKLNQVELSGKTSENCIKVSGTQSLSRPRAAGIGEKKVAPKQCLH